MMFKLKIALLIISASVKDCDNIICANIFDEVCGKTEMKDGTSIKMKYQNICYMRKVACKQESFVEINQVANELCNIKESKNISKSDENLDEGRRVYDFSIMGGQQACNHTCPTFCTDSYEPACAQIWKNNMVSSTFKPMINHCHIDLFSCVAGRNVTIVPLSKCYQNPMSLQFMQNIAAMKSLKFLDDLPVHRRGLNVSESDVKSEISLKKHLEDIVRRLFDKYNKKQVQSGGEDITTVTP